jgi:hypothetical protein
MLKIPPHSGETGTGRDSGGCITSTGHAPFHTFTLFVLFFDLFLNRLFVAVSVIQAGISDGANAPGQYKNYQCFFHTEWFYK